MPRFSLFLIVALAAGQAPTLAAECFYPDAVIIPDGERSTYEEMKAALTSRIAEQMIPGLSRTGSDQGRSAVDDRRARTGSGGGTEPAKARCDRRDGVRGGEI